MHEETRIYVVRVEGRVTGGFSEPLPDERCGDLETLALHEALMEHPDALGPVVSGSTGALGSMMEATIAVEASSFGEAANRAVAAYRASVLHAGSFAGNAASISEGSPVVFVEVHTEEEMDMRLSLEDDAD